MQTVCLTGHLLALGMRDEAICTNGSTDGLVYRNYALEPMMEHLKLWRKGDWKAATDLWEGGLAQLHQWYVSSSQGKAGLT